MAELARVIHHDPFAPVLFTSPALEVTEEQKQYMWEICQTAASDSRFAQKSYNAIIAVLTRGSVPLPVVNSLSPTSAALGSPSFTLHVTGSGFDLQSKIVWNGAVEPTIFVSETELTTEVNMGSAQVAVQIPVSVQTSNGVLSNTLLFELLPQEPAVMSQENPMTKRAEELEKKIRDDEDKRRKDAREQAEKDEQKRVEEEKRNEEQRKKSVEELKKDAEKAKSIPPTPSPTQGTPHITGQTGPIKK